MSEWISVKERLPESQADVLVVAFWHERWQTMMGWHSDMGKKWRVITPHGEREPGGVTHWMPLPAPPGEGNNVPNEPPNEPLTLEELREMDDEPVWCCPKNDSAKGSWMIVGPNGCENITSFAIYDDYGTGWLAYRRPPEVSS